MGQLSKLSTPITMAMIVFYMTGFELRVIPETRNKGKKF